MVLGNYNILNKRDIFRFGSRVQRINACTNVRKMTAKHVQMCHDVTAIRQIRNGDEWRGELYA